MKVIFNKYGGLSTIQDREILVQDSDSVNFLDVYYLVDDGQLVDPTVNLVTAMFRRSDGFVVGEIHLTPQEDANGLKFWRFVFTKESGTLAVAGELEITIRLKVAEYQNGQVLYARQRVGGLVVANVLRAISTPDEYNAYEARIFILEEKVELLLKNKPIDVIFNVADFTSLTTIEKQTITQQITDNFGVHNIDDFLLKFSSYTYHYESYYYDAYNKNIVIYFAESANYRIILSISTIGVWEVTYIHRYQSYSG